MIRKTLNVCSLVLIAGCLAACGAGGGATPAEQKALKEITENKGYREIVKKDHEESWQGLSAEDAFADAEKAVSTPTMSPSWNFIRILILRRKLKNASNAFAPSSPKKSRCFRRMR
ncbi:MAG: hypothetical protein R3C60_10170 [Parvularculaceae bacterium]